MSLRVLAACAGMAGVLAAAPAAGQDVICCKLLVPFHGNWIGAKRQCAAMLEQATEEQRKQACEALEKANSVCDEVMPYCVVCDQAKLDGLRGRMRGLAEAGRAHQKSENESREKRYAARDKLWGKGEGLKFEGGSISAFGEATLDSLILATGGGGSVGKAYGQVRKKYGEVKDWAETGWNLGSDPGSVENWGALGEKLLGIQADAVLSGRSEEALRGAREHFQKTGNYAGAQNVYRQKWGGYGALKDFKDAGEKVEKFAGALGKLQSLYETGDKLANDLQDWIDASRDQNAAERDREKLDAEIARVQKQIDALLAACGQKPAAALPDVLDSASAGASKADKQEQARRLQSARQALAALGVFQRTLRRADERLGAQIVAPFSPWFAGRWREAEPRALLVELVKASRQGLEQFDRTLGDLESRGAQARERLLAIPPDRGQ